MTELAQSCLKRGSKIEYSPVSLEKFSEMYDEPKGFGALLASMYEAGARGLLDQHSNDFEQLVHDKPQTFPEFLKMNNKNRTCDDSHRTSYSYIIKFNDIICYRNRKYRKLNALNLISLKRVERLLYHVRLQSVCSERLIHRK